jgi:glycosyltransferase involved in cell wall biosynthesis
VTAAVLINAHNYGRFLPGAIDSALHQTVQPAEIIVVDDGSTDDTASVCAQYGNKIRYIKQPNRGQAAAINAGFASVTAQVVCLLDADDRFYPNKIERVVSLMESDDSVGAVYNAYNVVTEDSYVISKGPSSAFRPAALRERALFSRAGGVPTSCISIRTPIAARMPIPVDAFRICADTYLLQVLPLVTAVAFIPIALTAYTDHGRNAFLSKSNADRTAMLALRSAVIRQTVKDELGVVIYGALDELKQNRTIREATGAAIRGLLYIAQHSRNPEIFSKEVLKLLMAYAVRVRRCRL